MTEIVPKTASNVHNINRGGRPSGLGYNPETGQELRGSTYVSSEDDVFGVVEARGYRPDRFYTASTNDNDHGRRINIRVPQGLDSQLYEVIAKFPAYRTAQDFFRDAALHRLEYLQHAHNLSDGIDRFCETERAEADREQRRAEVAGMLAKVANINQSLQEQWDAHDYGLMDKELDEARIEMERARDPYRAKIAECVDEWDRKASGHIRRHHAEREDR